MVILFRFDSNPGESFYQWASLLFSIWNENYVSMATQVNKDTHLGSKLSFYIPNIEHFSLKIGYLCIKLLYSTERIYMLDQLLACFFHIRSILAPPGWLELVLISWGYPFLHACSHLLIKEMIKHQVNN